MIDYGLSNNDIRYLIELVKAEDLRQMKKWGTQFHTPSMWMTILTEEVGELAKEMLLLEVGTPNNGASTTEAIHIATLALKIALMGRKK